MKYILITLLGITVAHPAFSQIKEMQKAQDVRKNYIDPEAKKLFVPVRNSSFVNPMIGTGGHGHTYPGAVAPFGMLQLSPDTRHDGWDGCSGYHYSDSVIYGFSHTHLSGTGVPDLCDILVVPQQGKALTEPGYAVKGGYGSPFSHAEEKAMPGLYEVKLKKNNISVRLTASQRCGMHEYTFHEAEGKKYILIDLDHRDELISASISKVNSNVLTGHRHSAAWAVNQKLFFRMEFNIPFIKSKLISKGNKHKMLLEFPESTKKILLKTGISAVDEQGAANNLAGEMPGWNFGAVYAATMQDWNTELGRIDFHSNEKEVMVNFYTALYHAYLCPSLFTDKDGRYLGNDGKIYHAGEQTQYSTFSLWDTYRAAHPLYTLTQRKRTTDFIHSFLNMYRQKGELPVWELTGNETYCMIGYHSVSVILDAYRKGIRNFDAELALEAMVKTAKRPHLGKIPYAQNGFLGTEVEPESVSKTLEYAYDDWCIAQFAKETGHEDVYQEFLARSYNFMNIFDPQTKFMRARRSGQWYTPFNPAEVNFNYTEANSWQYSLAAPQHISALRQAIGGKDSLQSWLDRLFTTESKLEGRHQVDITGLIGQYAHGNEPSHHMAYLYNYTNQPYQTQAKVDQILREMYHNAPDGLSGNEDCGQMSAWYVLSAMGIYPVCPGSTTYAIGRPMQISASMNFENGVRFTIYTENNSPSNKYVQSMKLNGKPYTSLFIDHNEMLKGGELVIVMGEKPNLSLKEYASDIQEKEQWPENVIPVPYFTATERTFSDSITTEIKMYGFQSTHIREKDSLVPDGFFITYTTDGSEPDVYSERYTKPLTFKQNTILKAKSFANYESYALKTAEDRAHEKQHPHSVAVGSIIDGIVISNNLSAVQASFSKRNKNISLALETKYANQYTAGGKDALIDGILSTSNDYRSGDWQGFQGTDARGTISFDTPQQVSEITVSALQDSRSWIFLPVAFEVEYSTDGINFKKLPAVKNTTAPSVEGTFSQKITVKLPASVNIKSIRFNVKSRGVCPPGHISAGETSWIFLDEIIVR